MEMLVEPIIEIYTLFNKLYIYIYILKKQNLICRQIN